MGGLHSSNAGCSKFEGDDNVHDDVIMMMQYASVTAVERAQILYMEPQP